MMLRNGNTAVHRSMVPMVLVRPLARLFVRRRVTPARRNAADTVAVVAAVGRGIDQAGIGTATHGSGTNA